MKSPKDNEMIRTYDVLVKRLQNANINPRKHVLDNEISVNMKEHIKDEYKFEIECSLSRHLTLQSTLPQHAGWNSRIILQVTLGSVVASNRSDIEPTTTIQHNSNSICSCPLGRTIDYNKMLLAPMGCKVQVHEKTDKRGMWAFNLLDGWYLYTSPKHYREHNCHIKETGSERLTDTIQFKHNNITNPGMLTRQNHS
ncbi:hypothetical protein ACHAXN_000395 [Cyclotella atomus]|jgi:hypothetical protein